jgi:hypothetical protein
MSGTAWASDRIAIKDLFPISESNWNMGTAETACRIKETNTT